MSEGWIKAIVLVCVFGAVLLAVESLVAWFAASRAHGRAINLRLKLIGQGKTRGEALTLLRESRVDLASVAPPPLRPMASRFDRMVTAARIRMSAGRLFGLLLIAPAFIFVILIMLAVSSGTEMSFSRVLLIATFAFAVGAGIPIMLLRMQSTRGRRRIQDQFPVALDVFVRGLRAGHPIAAALDLLTVEMPDPIGTEFGMVVDEITYGADMRDALSAMADRWDLEDMRMFVVSLSIQS